MFPRQYVILRQDSASSSRTQVLSEGSVWRGHPDRDREGERISLLYDAPEPCHKNVVFFFSSIWTDVTSKCCWHLLQILRHVFRALASVPPAPPLRLFISAEPYVYLFLLCASVNSIHFISSLASCPMQCSPSCFLCLWSFFFLPPRLPLSRFLCLCLTAGVFLKNNKVWGCACACVLRWLHRLDGLAALGWLLVWSPGKLYDLFS